MVSARVSWQQGFERKKLLENLELPPDSELHVCTVLSHKEILIS